MSQALVNKIYNGNKLLHAVYHGDVWTTNTFIAEKGRICPRVYKNTEDIRQTQNESNTPKLEGILDHTYETQPVTEVNKIDDITSEVLTEDYKYLYNSLYIEYMVKKYGINNLLLEPLGKTSRITGHDSEDGNYLAVLMGLRS